MFQEKSEKLGRKWVSKSAKEFFWLNQPWGTRIWCLFLDLTGAESRIWHFAKKIAKNHKNRSLTPPPLKTKRNIQNFSFLASSWTPHFILNILSKFYQNPFRNGWVLKVWSYRHSPVFMGFVRQINPNVQRGDELTLFWKVVETALKFHPTPIMWPREIQCHNFHQNLTITYWDITYQLHW